jgi:TatD DNase family protein
MTFIDTHSHLEICKNLDNLIKQAKKTNTNIILTAGTDIKSNRQTLTIAKKYKEVKACLGIYPDDALKLTTEQINKEIEFIKQNKNNIVAIGEVGLDLKHSKSNTLQKQIQTLKQFINLAKQLNKPIIVHSRQAEQQAIETLEKNKAEKVIMHCFCGSQKLVKRIIENKYTFSIPTNITISQQFQDLVKITPITQLLAETDSPFLHPIKGQRNNEPKNIIESYKEIARIKNLTLEQVEEQLQENFNKLFKK